MTRTARQTYVMLEKESLWQTALQCHELLQAASIPHALMGGMAVCLHGYQRSTVDIDLLIRRADAVAVRALLEQHDFRWQEVEPSFARPTAPACNCRSTGTAPVAAARSFCPIRPPSV